MQTGDGAETTEAQGLSARLRERIARDGPITFAAFMDAALYDPDHGFYSTPPVGERGHFVTAPHVSGLYGTLLARIVDEMWEALERPDPFHVIEAGAGDGTLAAQLLDALAPETRAATRYTAVERSSGARSVLEARGLNAVERMEQLPPGIVGCVLANELLDNLPFHLVRGTPEGPRELLVALAPEGFHLVEGPLSSPSLSPLASGLAAGEEAVISLAALSFVGEAVASLRRGYVWIADYGFSSGRAPGPHAYRGHRVESEVLSDPGSRDITAGMDFSRLVEHARSLGARTWGPIFQRDALLAAGYREHVERARSRQSDALAEGRGLEAARLLSERNRAGLLVDPAGLGGLLWLCLGVGVEAPPSAFSRAGREVDR